MKELIERMNDAASVGEVRSGECRCEGDRAHTQVMGYGDVLGVVIENHTIGCGNVPGRTDRLEHRWVGFRANGALAGEYRVERP